MRSTLYPRPTSRSASGSSPRRSARRERAAEARYPTCGVRGCANDRFLQTDHVVALADGGLTEDGNLWRLCTFHHDKKTYAGWKVVGTTHNWNLVPPDNDPDPP